MKTKGSRRVASAMQKGHWMACPEIKVMKRKNVVSCEARVAEEEEENRLRSRSSINK